MDQGPFPYSSCLISSRTSLSPFLSFLDSFFLGFLSCLSAELGAPWFPGGPGAGGSVSSEKCTEAGLEVRLVGRSIPFGEPGAGSVGGGGGGGG